MRDKNKVLNSEVVPFDREEMLAMIKNEITSSKRIKVLERELKKVQPGPILSVEDVRAILSDLIFDRDKEKAFVSMLDYMDLNEKEAIMAVIDGVFMRDSSKVSAQKKLAEKSR